MVPSLCHFSALRKELKEDAGFLSRKKRRSCNENKRRLTIVCQKSMQRAAAITPTVRNRLTTTRRLGMTSMALQLPHIPEVDRLSPSVLRILGGNPSKFTLQGTNTYLIGRAETRNRILIDTAQGFPSWKKLLGEVLEKENATVTTCLITHFHHDHVGGIKDLKELCPGVEVWKYAPEVWDHDVDGSERGWRPNASGEVEVKEIKDGMVFEGEEGTRLKAVHCPGHTDDHCAFVMDHGSEDDQRAIFTGDNVLGHGTSVFSSLAQYMQSLHVMAKELPANGKVRAYPAHGVVIEDGRAKLEEYIEHRKQREAEILTALESNETDDGMTAMQIVKIVYKEYPINLHEPAKGGVLQVLSKLEGEGRVHGMNEGRWSLINRGSPSSPKSAL